MSRAKNAVGAHTNPLGGGASYIKCRGNQLLEGVGGGGGRRGSKSNYALLVMVKALLEMYPSDTKMYILVALISSSCLLSGI